MEGSQGTGITIWDGQFFRRLTIENGLPSNQVTAMCEAIDGSVWISTLFHGVVKISKTGERRYFTSRDGLPDNTVYAIYCACNNLTWVGTSNGLCTIDSSGIIRNIIVDDNKNPDIHGITGET